MLDPRARGRFRSNRAALLGAGVVVLLVLFAAVGPLLAGHDPYTSDFAAGVSPESTPVGPSAAHWLGTDRIYRDELARLAHGARLSLLIGLSATIIATVLGGAVGIVAGYYEGTEGLRLPWAFLAALAASFALLVGGRPGIAGGVLLAGAAAWVAAALARSNRLARGPSLNADVALMRLVDVGLSFPFLLLVMALSAAHDRTTVTSILVTLGLTGWLGTARVLRAKTMQIRNLEYVTASRALGQSTAAIMWRHVLPNVSGPLVVIATISVAQMILAESVLSYLGAGIAPPSATWGFMLFEGQDYLFAAPWLVAAPAVAILLAVFGFNLLGEGLRDALDPRAE